MTKTEAAETGTLETGEILPEEEEVLPEEEEVLPEAGADPEIPVRQEAVPAGVPDLPEVVIRTAVPETADPHEAGM